MRQGHAYKRGKTWAYVVDVALPGEKRKQKTKSGFPTKKAALAAMQEVQVAVTRGSYLEPSKLTLAEYLTDWLVSIRRELQPGTFDSYELHCRRYIVPSLGGVPLRSLTRTRVKAFYADLSTEGRVRRQGGLSTKTVHNIHLTLRKALNDAVEDSLISQNPAAGAHRLSSARPEPDTWTPAQLRQFLDYVEGDRLAAAWRLAAMTGMRRGEVLGLRWQDADLENGRVSVRQQLVKANGSVAFGQPKTAKGRRSLVIDEGTRRSLREHRRRCAEERLRFGPGYVEQGLVFTREDGSPLDPDTFSQRFLLLSRRARLPAIKFHGLRHTHATHALVAGVHPKVVQERLGHSSITVTLDTYSHAVPSLETEAADRIAAVLENL